MKKYSKKSKLPKYDGGGMSNDQYNMSLYSQEDQDALNGNSTSNIYNQKRGANISPMQYAGYGMAAANTAGNIAAINNGGYDENTKAAYQGQAIGSGLTQSGAAFSPLIGMGTGIRKSATNIIGDEQGSARTASNWMAAPHEAAMSDFSAAKNSENTQSQKLGAYGAAIGDFNPAGTKLRQMFSYGTGNDEKTTGFWGKYNDLTGISARNNQKNSLGQEFAMGGMNMQPNAVPQYPNGGTIPRLQPRDFKSEKAHYEEQTRGANQADGSGISSAELAYRYSKLIDPTGVTSATEIGKNFYMGNKQDPIDYLGLVRVPFVKEGMKAISKLAKQGNKAHVLINGVTKTNDTVEAYGNGGMSQDGCIHAPEMGGYFRKKSR